MRGKRKGSCLWTEIVSNKKGRTTIETALLFPIIVFLFLGMFLALLFLLDMSVAESETMIQANEALAAWKLDGNLPDGMYKPQQLIKRDKWFLVTREGSGLEAQMKNRMSRRIPRRTAVTRLTKTGACARGKTISAEVKVVFRWPLQGICEMAGFQTLIFHSVTEVWTDRREERIRKLNQEGTHGDSKRRAS